MSAQLFEYAVILDEKRDKDGEVTEEASVLVPVQSVLVRDEKQAQLVASRSIPEDAMDKMDRLTVVVRPF